MTFLTAEQWNKAAEQMSWAAIKKSPLWNRMEFLQPHDKAKCMCLCEDAVVILQWKDGAWWDNKTKVEIEITHWIYLGGFHPAIAFGPLARRVSNSWLASLRDFSVDNANKVVLGVDFASGPDKTKNAKYRHKKD